MKFNLDYEKGTVIDLKPRETGVNHVGVEMALCATPAKKLYTMAGEGSEITTVYRLASVVIISQGTMDMSKGELHFFDDNPERVRDAVREVESAARSRGMNRWPTSEETSE